MGMTNNKGVRLRRCPFCGGSARVYYGGLYLVGTVQCTKCYAKIGVMDENDAVSEAIKKWNKRVAPKRKVRR